MKMFLVIAVLAGMMVGCTKAQVSAVVNTAGCDAEQFVSTEVANVVVAQLSCANASVVQNDVLGLVQKSNICKQVPAPAPASALQAKKGVLKDAAPAGPSAIALLVCPTLANTVVGAASAQIPATWGCTGGAVTTGLNTAILNACESKL